MATQFQPPPTYADPVVYDDATRKQQFNPIWLKWFLDVSQYISNNGGGGTIQHNNLGGLQGGLPASSEFYHLTNNAYSILKNISAPTAGSVAYGTGSEIAFTAAGSAGQVLTSAGAGTPVWTSLSGTAVTSFSGGTTGLTPNTPTAGAVVLGGTLVIANGGTNGSATPTAGALAYGTGTAYAFTAAGTSGYFIKSAGTGTPVWSNSVGGYIVDGTSPYLDWGNGAAVTLAAGRMWYNGTTGSLNFGMGGGNITQQIGEELFVYGKASAAITDSPLQIVYHTGTVGSSGVIKFAPTIAGITDINAIVGVATEPIALNAFGRITSFGVIHGITTNGTAYGETWADDDVIWYNPVTGNPTKFEPSAPNIKVQVGIVISAGSGGSGSFQVLLRPGSVLGGTDSNVQFGTLANGDLIQYNSTLQYWTNVTPASVIAGANGAPVTKTANFTVAAGETWLINNKSGSSCTVTLPTASTNTGRVLRFQNYQAQTLVSASSNVVPLVGGAASTAILNAVAGDTATLVSDGTNWVMTQYVPNNVLLLE
jgi:hypothetical protein